MKEFQGELQTGHKQNAVEVPFDPAIEWGMPAVKLWNGRNGHPAQTAINGVKFESFVVPRSKKFFLLIDEDISKAAKVNVGDRITVFIAPSAVPVDLSDRP